MSRQKNARLGCLLLLLWLFDSTPSIGLHLHYQDTSLIPELVSKAWSDTPLLRLPEFAAGMILALFWVRRRDKPAKADPTSPWPLLAIFSAIAVYLCFFPDWLHQVVLLPLFLLLIFRCAVDRSAVSRALSHPIPVRLGEASYAVYILHIPLFVYWHGWLRPQAISTLFALTYLAIITVLSLGVYAWLEKPIAKWVRNRFAHVAGAEPSELRVRIAESGTSS